MAKIRLSYRGTPRPFARIRERVNRPFGGGRGKAIQRVMRSGVGSVAHQLQASTTMSAETGTRRMKPVRAFGRRPAPSRPLHRSGELGRAWQGRSALSIEAVEARRVMIGVTGYPAIHQRGAVVRPRRRTARGDYKMRMYLGLTHGAWLRKATLERGLRIPARPVAISRPMLSRAARVTLDIVVKGSAGG